MTSDIASEALDKARSDSERKIDAAILALISEAELGLLEAVTQFLREMKSGGEERLGRNPFSEDLLPYFQRYAFSVFDVLHKNDIVAASSLDEARTLMRAAVEQLLNKICSKRREVGGKGHPGVWIQTVEHASRIVDFGHWTTRFGSYDRSALMNPRRGQLRALLQVHALALESEFWSCRAKEGSADLTAQMDVARGTRHEVVGPYKERADWLQQRLNERAWSLDQLHQERGPDPKTARKVLLGWSVRPGTIGSIAKAFGVDASQIPNR